ncbi:hypothetical protein [Chryseobacterium polytrichastri]|uniref:Uncharacterized protein n=1 Tax=Chryseobacterium polytrichastri TaxID=1302687 RepID=A0A1M7ISG0_9FLAO|nr:hypothetical protein [Chryseobacterium polytrichastri]SHM43553.1 hypothetical protein SAMN05444267_10481 [Chryseobacterium polytrichastri]
MENSNQKAKLEWSKDNLKQHCRNFLESINGDNIEEVSNMEKNWYNIAKTDFQLKKDSYFNKILELNSIWLEVTSASNDEDG